MTDRITHLIHHPYQPPAGFEAPQPGVFKASTVFFPTVAAMRSREWKDKSAYTYGLHGTPTSYALEERLATLEGGKECLLVPSGLAALGLVALSLLKSGDEVLLPDNAYGPNKSIVEGELMGWGITHQYYNPMDPEDLEAQISSRTKLVWLEAAGSVSLEFPNIVEMVRICQRRKVLTALDNTWGAGLAFNPFDLVHPQRRPAPQAQADPYALRYRGWHERCGSCSALLANHRFALPRTRCGHTQPRGMGPNPAGVCSGAASGLA
jgi:cystathionine beta-lyase